MKTCSNVAPPRGVRGLKSCTRAESEALLVAPPRGVRGLKSLNALIRLTRAGRTPSWGAWIEMFSLL